MFSEEIVGYYTQIEASEMSVMEPLDVAFVSHINTVL